MAPINTAGDGYTLMYDLQSSNSSYVMTGTYSGTIDVSTTSVSGINIQLIYTGQAQTTAPTITTQPTNSAVTVGGTASLSLVASGSGTLSYQWYSNTTSSTTGGISINGATSATYVAPTTTVGTKYYYCIVTNTVGTSSSPTTSIVANVVVTPQSSAKNITGFTFAGISPAVTGTISGTNIAVTVPAGTSVTALFPTITVSPNATVAPASAVAHDFTNPVTYTVTAQDGSIQTYTVTVTVATTTGQGPSFQNVSLDPTNKIVTLVFDEALTSNVADLKSAIELATNGTTFNALGASDSVTISSTDAKELIVTLNSALTGANNKLQIAANSLKDANGNVQTSVVTTPAISGTIDECFIATAAYGSISQQPVVLLRHFRDKFLLTNAWGQSFVKFYYHNSPPVARFIAGNEFLKLVVRIMLSPALVVAYLLFHPVLGIAFFSLFTGIAYMWRNQRKKLLHV